MLCAVLVNSGSSCVFLVCWDLLGSRSLEMVRTIELDLAFCCVQYLTTVLCTEVAAHCSIGLMWLVESREPRPESVWSPESRADSPD